ncbi:hypothetical protein KC315_g11375, partial [Hortaea werneckii]
AAASSRRMQSGIAAARQAPASPDDHDHFYGDDLDEETAADLAGAAIHHTNALGVPSSAQQETRRRKRAAGASAVDAEPAPQPKRARKKKQAAIPEAEEAAPAPKAKRARKKKQAAPSDTEKAEFADVDAAAAAKTEVMDAMDLAIPSIDGETMLSLLDQAVREKLGQEWSSKLDLFLKSVREDPLQTPQGLQQDLENRWQLFKEAEPRVWSDVGQPAKSSDNLIKFDGDCSAKICVVMHYPTFSKTVKTFFDAENPCLDRMMKKGLSAETCFGFDVHHRQEHSKDYQRDHCPGTEYPEACVQKTYAARFPKQAMRAVEVTVSGNRKVKFLLRTDGSDGNIASLAVCCPHPEGLFLANATEGPLRACQMDSAINTVMTLSSLPTRSAYFARFYEFNTKQRKQGGGVKAANPLNKISEILQDEENACKVVPRHEYPTWVLDWVTKTYPTLDLDDPESKGLSIAVAIQQAKSDKTAKTKYEKAEDKSNYDRDAPCRGTTSSAYDTRDWFHGGHITMNERKGGCGWYITLDYQNPGSQRPQDSTRYRTTVSSPLLYKGQVLKLFFGKDSIYGLDDNDRYIFERSYASIRFQSYGSKFVERALLEYDHHQRGDVA